MSQKQGWLRKYSFHDGNAKEDGERHGSVDLGPRLPSSVVKPGSVGIDSLPQAPTQSVPEHSNQSPKAPATPLADALLEAITLKDMKETAMEAYFTQSDKHFLETRQYCFKQCPLVVHHFCLLLL